MFDNQFYPTPTQIIKKMLSDVNFDMINSVLEPSAGKGDIAEAVKSKMESRYREDVDIDCIEIEENLRHILRGKGLRVVYNDFLTYSTQKEYELIVMNPPFADGDKHLLKALEMQKRNGGSVICLLNAETIRNPFSNIRKDLVSKLNEYDAKIEYIPNAFVDAERKAEVEVALIKVKLPEVNRDSFIIDNLKKAETVTDKEIIPNKLITDDFLENIVQQYNMEVSAGVKLINEYKAMCPYIMSAFKEDEQRGYFSDKPMLELSETSVNKYIKMVRRKYWSALFSNKQFTGRLTGNLRDEFYSRVSELEDYEFSLYNIYEIKIQMSQSMVKGVEKTIIALFDKLSYEHSWNDEYSKNIHYFNGWKTNKAHIINKKVIIPLDGYYDLEYSWGGFRPTNYKTVGELSDIEKCFDYLAGDTYGSHMEYRLERAEKNGQTKNIHLKYFDVTFYKKGTCHITFTDDDLLKKFNLFGCQRKGWLPPSYGKKKYSEMDAEERRVIDEFEGEASYAETLKNKEYFICEDSSLAKLLAA